VNQNGNLWLKAKSPVVILTACLLFMDHLPVAWYKGALALIAFIAFAGAGFFGSSVISSNEKQRGTRMGRV